MKLRFSKINHIFISHLHGDHYFGLVGLLSSFHLLDRRTPLTVYGPTLLKDIIEIQLKASNTQLRFPLHFKATQSGNKQVLFEDDKVRVSSFPLLHSIPTTGFLFEEKPKLRTINLRQIQGYDIPVWALNTIKRGADFVREDGEVIPNSVLTLDPPTPVSYAFCSDTAYHEQLAAYIKGVTVLYHETTFMAADQRLANKSNHSTTVDAAKVAKEVGAGCLITGHYSVRYDDFSAFAVEAKVQFPNTFEGKDGATYEWSSQEGELKVTGGRQGRLEG